MDAGNTCRHDTVKMSYSANTTSGAADVVTYRTELGNIRVQWRAAKSDVSDLAMFDSEVRNTGPTTSGVPDVVANGAELGNIRVQMRALVRAIR